MSSYPLPGEKKRRDISICNLKMRLVLNKKYQSRDFQAWLGKRIVVKNIKNIRLLANIRSFQFNSRYAETFKLF